MHQRFQLSVGFDGELVFSIKAGQQGGDRFSLVGENEIVIARFTFFLIQIETAPLPFIRILLVDGIMQIAVVHKVRIEIGEFGCVVIFLIVAMLEDPDAKSILFVGIRVEFDPFIQLENAADVGKGRLFVVEAFRRAGTVAFDGHAAKNGRIPVVKLNKIELSRQFCRHDHLITGLVSIGFTIIISL